MEKVTGATFFQFLLLGFYSVLPFAAPINGAVGGILMLLDIGVWDDRYDEFFT